MLDKMNHYAILFDFYGQLLTDKQQAVFDLYYQQNWSLAEIAGYYQVSRPAVHDLIKRVEKQLNNYEAKLNLVTRFYTIDRELEALLLVADDLARNSSSPDVEILHQRLKALLQLTRE